MLAHVAFLFAEDFYESFYAETPPFEHTKLYNNGTLRGERESRSFLNVSISENSELWPLCAHTPEKRPPP